MAAETEDTGQKEKEDNNKNKNSPIPSNKKSHQPSGGIDKTPLPPAPPGYTLKFTFHRATNLPAADVSTVSADPFLIAKLRTPGSPNRHKQDPDPHHRTPTLRRTTDPQWDDEWIVANVPPSGFVLKCRLYDEDYPDHNDALGRVTIKCSRIDDDWSGLGGAPFPVKKRKGSKRAYGAKALGSCLHPRVHLTATLYVSVEVLGRSDPPHAHVYTVGPTFWVKHYSPMIGRIAGTKVDKDKDEDEDGNDKNKKDGKTDRQGSKSEKNTQKHDFQANEMQLSGPVPPSLYHRYVTFKPIIKHIFSYAGFRGKILHKALKSQHAKIYNYDRTTERSLFPPRSPDASLAFLRLAHFDQGARIFTYVLTLDAVFRFTETGSEFGIDLLSKHTMHADVETYVACAGEFLIRRLDNNKPTTASNPSTPKEKEEEEENPPSDDPKNYQLIIDNDSGTYRPSKSILPALQSFLQTNFPDLSIQAMHWQDQHLKELKEAQKSAKQKQGRKVPMVMRSSPSSSSISSDESSLDSLERTTGAKNSQAGVGAGTAGDTLKMTKDKALDLVEDPSKLKDFVPPLSAFKPAAAAAGEGEHGRS